MKTILLAVATALLVSCATAPAKSAVDRPAPSKAAAAPAAPVSRQVTFEEALPTSIKSYYANGDSSGGQTFQYNSNGQLVRQETFNGNGLLTEIRTGAAKGNLWRVTVTNAQSGEVVSFEDLSYGPQGQLLSQTLLNPKEVPQASNEYSYDGQARKAVWLAKTGGGGLQAKTVYSYDAHGNNIKTEVFDSGGQLTNVFQSTFDDQSRILTRQGFDQSNQVVEQTNFTWKDQLKVKEETTIPLLRTIEYVYGAKPAPTGITSSVRGKVVERQTFEYQWFSKTKTVNP